MCDSIASQYYYYNEASRMRCFEVRLNFILSLHVLIAKGRVMRYKRILVPAVKITPMSYRMVPQTINALHLFWMHNYTNKTKKNMDYIVHTMDSFYKQDDNFVERHLIENVVRYL